MRTFVAAALVVACAACGSPLRGVGPAAAGAANVEATDLIQVSEHLATGVPVPAVIENVRCMADMVEASLRKLKTKSEEHAIECDAKLGSLQDAVKRSTDEHAFAADRLVAVKAQVHTKSRALDKVKAELRDLTDAIEAKEKEMEKAFMEHGSHVEALKTQRAGHEEAIWRARKILESVRSSGLTVGDAEMTALVEVAARRVGARAHRTAKRVQAAVAAGETEPTTQAEVEKLLGKLVSSVEGSLVASKAHHDRAVEAWERSKAAMHAQVEALATRKSSKLSQAALLHQQLSLQNEMLDQARTHDAATAKHLKAAKAILAGAEKHCDDTQKALTDEVMRKEDDLSTAHTLEDLLANHHMALMASGSTGATGAAASGFASMDAMPITE